MAAAAGKRGAAQIETSSEEIAGPADTLSSDVAEKDGGANVLHANGKQDDEDKDEKEERDDEVDLNAEETVEKHSTKDETDQTETTAQDANEAGEDSDEEQEHVDSPVATSAGADVAESLRRKRDREGSLEPSLSQRESHTTDALPSKKNRLQEEKQPSDKKPSADQPSEARTSFEGEKVGQIRKRVQDLSWKQRKEGERDDGQDDEDEERSKAARMHDKDLEAAQEEAIGAKDAKDPPPLRKQATFSSFSSKTSGFGAAPKKSASVFDAATSKENAPSSPPAAMRTQPTFSSFSSSSSPFNTASASIAGPSWLAGKSSTSGGIKPSTLGSMGAAGEREAHSSSPASANKDTAATPASSSSKPLGFGAFAASKSFGPGSGTAGSRSSTPASNASDKPATTGSDDAAGSSKSFDEALRKNNDSSEDTSPSKPKVTTQADRGQADLRTGEEDEQTIASVRAKLFTMADDKSWKERGTGTVRCNIGKDDASKGARLVMRAEGVLRLILNVKLFKGMGFNLEQDKFIRIVAMEEGKTTTFAIKVGNAAAANHFFRTVKGAIPRNDALLADSAA